MTKNELVKLLYAKYNKFVLNAHEAAREWGSSYSKLSKLFGGKDALSEKIILERKIIPKWTLLGKKRVWKITDIADWIIETEQENAK